jgi:lycopene beta-cyclase
MTKSDYIILGAGASGLMLAYRMSQDPFFDDKSILIIDKEKDKGNDRTWCYWEDGDGEWDSLLSKKWSSIFFGSDFYSNTINISPYHYKLIRSEDFYKSLWSKIEVKPNINFIKAEVKSVSETNNGAEALTNQGAFFGSKLFNSLPNPEVYRQQKKFPVLQQHFVGWFVETEKNLVDEHVATFMDFSIPQDGNTRFMYVLPLGNNTVLFEYTLFSEKLLPYEDYGNAIKTYLKDKGILNYKIIEKEAGSIPMTSFEFSKLNSKHILNIGTAGGWTKASTGYTFKKTSKKTKELVAYLKEETDLSQFSKKTKYWFYDLLFLDVLGKHNNEGAILFSSMFKKANTTTIFRFLDEDSTLVEDLKVILSVPSKRFIQALLRRLF